MTNKLAPYGWDIPTYANCVDLITAVGYGSYNPSDGTYTLAGGHLKEEDTTTWLSPNTGADDSVGFKALSAGYRTTLGVYQDMHRFTDFWTSSTISTGYNFDMWVAYNDSTARTRALNAYKYGISVRCRRPLGKYGAIYNWFAVTNPKVLAPIGCHIPTKDEITTLVTYLGGSAAAGAKLKENGSHNWTSNKTTTTNSSKFLGLPNGERHYNGGFYDLSNIGYWWTSTQGQVEIQYAFGIRTYSDFNDLITEEVPVGNGFGVRCICDNDVATVTDIDGNIYDTVLIGTQRWLVQDLRVTKYRDGSSVSVITDSSLWQDAGYSSTPAMCYYNNSMPIANQPSTITDVDGNSYDVVEVGSNLWTKQNLKTTKYNDGTSIPNVTDASTWAALTSGAMCAYDNNENNV